MNTETKFTLGPWKASEYGTTVYSGETITEMICDCHVNYRIGDKNRANATLIAAAPDIYEALEYMNTVLRLYKGKQEWDEDNLFTKAMKKATAALNKANPQQ